ncbi:nucleoside 2-deoxyribosyltransferase [Caballeronia sp. LZ001]|uniref:nucleoside 2-deoxyribosyltransferase n=1 Tax=Caballeronia sp. LZ001 TaxID=3038553 RepID=UPI0028565202|nr:nucleoside 2-deoxyribosyltransferase [Caballeronia sp. LZ001]MDR5803733.1 nucleoside 2-deoxyribosyltransferase [Caballeronia sp. LZ001]
MAATETLLVVGELVVDFTLPQSGFMCKLRLGGVAHAARGLWAANIEYSVAAFCPRYLVDEARRYLESCACEEFIWLGDVIGAPNVVIIQDATEVGHQGYEDLMRDKKQLLLHEQVQGLDAYRQVLVFPSRFDMQALAASFAPDASFAFDIAYDLDDIALLDAFRGRTRAVIISTSSVLFARLGKDDVSGLVSAARTLSPEVLLLKENRGGSRLFDIVRDTVEEIPATLGKTVNSVGVGDVYSAVMVALAASLGWSEAAWRGCQAATIYSQTTFPDDIRRDLQRCFTLPLSALQSLGGASLPWHERPRYSIYFAGPDFSYVEKQELEAAAKSLSYHNFKVRRPIRENGELQRPASAGELHHTYQKDLCLLQECDAVFAVPLERDPGTLVEIGMAIQMSKPVVTYDPRKENENTMVMVGSSVYSADLDACLNGIFDVVAKLRGETR